MHILTGFWRTSFYYILCYSKYFLLLLICLLICLLSASYLSFFEPWHCFLFNMILAAVCYFSIHCFEFNSGCLFPIFTFSHCIIRSVQYIFHSCVVHRRGYTLTTFFLIQDVNFCRCFSHFGIVAECLLFFLQDCISKGSINTNSGFHISKSFDLHEYK